MYTFGAKVFKKDRVYTFEDYLSFDENFRCEIMNGCVYLKESPWRVHQRISGYISYKLSQFLDGKHCEVYFAPFSVVLMKNLKDDAADSIDITEFKSYFEDETDPLKSQWVVEPDILVICDRNKYMKESCVGTPDFIIEIVSPSSRIWDMRTKRDLYELNGVREYWTVDVEKGRIIKRVLNEYGMFDDVVSVYSFSDTVPCTVLEGCEIDFSGVDLT
jgi:Uma2 family endonuclease